jgi:putative heme iron utilization protein
VLGTLSLALPGYPFVSIVPYVLDERAWPVVLVSRLAEHTRNMAADARVSLFVHEALADVQAGARVTLMGQGTRLEDPDGIKARYFRYFPHARSYYDTDTLDFDFYCIEPVTLRVVGGFARVHWVSREAYTIREDAIVRNEAKVIESVNRHHGPLVRRYCASAAGTADDALVIGVDCEGFDIRAGERVLRAQFDKAPAGMGDITGAMLAVLRGGQADAS